MPEECDTIKPIRLNCLQQLFNAVFIQDNALMFTSEAPSIVKISNGVKTPIITSSSLFAYFGFKCKFLEKTHIIFGVLRGKFNVNYFYSYLCENFMLL